MKIPTMVFAPGDVELGKKIAAALKREHGRLTVEQAAERARRHIPS
jgi:hypothetical protein